MPRAKPTAAVPTAADLRDLDRFAALLLAQGSALPSRATLARRLRAEGRTVRAIAAALRCSERRIYQFLSRGAA